MPTWLLTSTTYGTWLPGDSRGSIASVREVRNGEQPSVSRREHDQPGQPYEASLPGLAEASRQKLKCPPVLLTSDQATTLLDQFRETARRRGHQLHAVAIMANHFHMVVTSAGDPNPGKLLGDFKAYGSRALNTSFDKPVSGTWWTSQGSKRKLSDKVAITSAIRYVLEKQPNPLVTWAPQI